MSVKYGLGNPPHSRNEILVEILSVMSAIAQGASSLCLSLALLHQLRWRSKSKLMIAEEASKVGVLVHHDSPNSTLQSGRSLLSETLNSSLYDSNYSWNSSHGPSPRDFKSPPAPVASGIYVSETTPFFMRGTPKSTLRKVMLFFVSWEVLFFLLLTAFVTFTFLSSIIDSIPLFYTSAALYISLHIPPILLCVIILLRHVASSFDAQKTAGPRFTSRIILILAILLNLLLGVPVYAWSKALAHCTFLLLSLPAITFQT